MKTCACIFALALQSLVLFSGIAKAQKMTMKPAVLDFHQPKHVPLGIGHDQGYRWDGTTEHDYDSMRNCVNKKGRHDHNYDFIGECGELTCADLKGRDLRDKSFVGADVSGNFSGANLEGVNLTGMTVVMRFFWTNDIPKGTDCTNSFENANLKNAKFAHVYLSGHMSFAGADLRGTDMSGTKSHDWDEINLQNAIYDEHTLLPFSQDEAEFRDMIYKPTGETQEKNP